MPRRQQTDVEAFAVLEPTADGFRNYLQKGHDLAAEHLLVDKAFMLKLSAPEMTALLGGLRVLERQRRAVRARRLHRPARDADQRLLREPARHGRRSGRRPRKPRTCSRVAIAQTGELRWTGTRVDLIFGSSSELRALAEVYASDDAEQKFVRDFVAAWDKVMNLDRFDLA